MLRVPARDHPDDGALQRGSPQQPLADQVHVPGGVHPEADGGPREEHPFVGQQQGQAARDPKSRIGRHVSSFGIRWTSAIEPELSGN